MRHAAHWRGRERFVLFDSAYGDGSRFHATVHGWRADPQRPKHLHYIALASGSPPGFRRIVQDDSNLTLDLLYAPLSGALAQLGARIDALQLHDIAKEGAGFVRPLVRLLAEDARLHAEDLAEEQAQALQAAGFIWQERPSGARVEALYASRKPAPAARPAPQRRALVIGAGLAGSSACERLCARGWQVTLIERHAQAATEASGNLAGILMPLLSKDDNIPTRLSRAAYLYALAYWERLGGVGAAIEGANCGVLQLARDAAQERVQRAVANSWHYPPEYADWLDRDAAGALLGRPAAHGGWLFPRGGWIRPGSACEAMLDACGARLERRFGVGSVRIEAADGEWRVIDAGGDVLAQAPTMIVANGVGALQLAQASGLPLAAVRGQVTHLAADQLQAPKLVLCREAYVTPVANGIACVGASYDNDSDAELRASSQRENLEKAGALLGEPELGRDAPLQGRVGFRCVAPDRLPLVGALPVAGARIERLRDMPRQPGLYALLGYASRGLTWAPLAAELLAAQLEGEPLPLEASLAAALDPARFLLRARQQVRKK